MSVLNVHCWYILMIGGWWCWYWCYFSYLMWCRSSNRFIKIPWLSIYRFLPCGNRIFVLHAAYSNPISTTLWAVFRCVRLLFIFIFLSSLYPYALIIFSSFVLFLLRACVCVYVCVCVACVGVFLCLCAVLLNKQTMKNQNFEWSLKINQQN